eukprot:GEMP01080732.1.p1 GENE.GEMP01080732.1~~GEMP01080732.1.p1  ORF type:complete len:135 (+),score=27.49 GEMP01080732.1:38-406(+)
MSAWRMEFMSKRKSANDSAAVESLLSDLKMLSAYETAANWMEPKAMDKAFNAFTWGDDKIASALPRYLSASPAEKARVDYAFNALVPRPADPKDSKQTMMHSWLKSRLFSYDQAFPFDFNPY